MSSSDIMVVMWGEKVTAHIQNINQIHGNVNDNITKEIAT